VAIPPARQTGNIIADSQSFGLGSRVEVSAVGPCLIYTYINGASEFGLAFTATVDCHLVRAWCTSATCLISKLASITIANYNTTAQLRPDFLVLSSAGLQYELEWAIRAGEIVYFRIAGSSHFGFAIRPTPDFLR
jgi:hypothetical protein